jgi:hypothetical protein
MKTLLLFLVAMTAFGQFQLVRQPDPTVVASLPTASSNTRRIYIVTDGASASDCSTGGGSTRVICMSNGSTWVANSGTGSSVTAGFGLVDTAGTFSVNNAVIAELATVQAGTPWYCRSTTGNDTYTCTVSPSETSTSLSRGQYVFLDPDTANTGAATISIGGGTARAIVTTAGADPADGAIVANRGNLIYWNGTNFNQVGAASSGGGIGTAGSINLAPTGTNDGAQSGAGPWRTGGVAVRVTSAITQGGIDSIQFDNSTGGDPTTYATISVPSDWNNAGTVAFTGLIWDASGTNTSITIKVNAVCAGDGDAIGVTYGTSQSVAVSNPSNSVQRAFTISPVTTTGCASGKVMGIRLSLDRASTNQAPNLRMSNMKLNYVRQ